MEKQKVSKFLEELSRDKDRNIVIIDFGNVQKWEKSLGWKIGIKELGNLVKHFSQGKKFLRRFYYGSDFGPKDKSKTLSMWSLMILNKARMNRFDVVTKRVKYILEDSPQKRFSKKCNFDIEIAVDLIKESKNYDRAILFSGDGDFSYLLEFLKEKYNKKSVVFGARGHVGKELYDAKYKKVVGCILYAEDFEYRLNRDRFRFQ